MLWPDAFLLDLLIAEDSGTYLLMCRVKVDG